MCCKQIPLAFLRRGHLEGHPPVAAAALPTGATAAQKALLQNFVPTLSQATSRADSLQKPKQHGNCINNFTVAAVLFQPAFGYLPKPHCMQLMGSWRLGLGRCKRAVSQGPAWDIQPDDTPAPNKLRIVLDQAVFGPCLGVGGVWLGGGIGLSMNGQGGRAASEA